jgi:integral membrane protein
MGKMLNLRLLRWASLAEGTTLILLVCLAVPLKRMAGMPEFVTLMGPLHGAAFLVYLAMVMRAASVGLLTAMETVRLVLVAFIPFGVFFVVGIFKRKAASLGLARSGAIFPARP